MPLAEQASKAGIKMMYQNVPVPTVVAKFGGGYVGAQQEPQGHALGAKSAIRRFGLKKGDTAIVLGRFDDADRARARSAARLTALEGGRRRRSSRSIVATGMGGRSEPRHSGHHRGVRWPIPTAKAIVYPGGQLLGNAPTYMQAAGKKPGEIFNFGFDTSPQIVEAFKGGWVQLTADQQPFLQGYLPILSLCEQVVYGLGADQCRHRRRLRDAGQLQGRRRARQGRRCANRQLRDRLGGAAAIAAGAAS